MIEVTSTFSGRLNEALDIRQIKPVDLSKRTGISEATISQYRSGYAKPKQKKLALLADALRVNPVWLMGLNVPMEIQRTVDTQAETDSGIDFVIETMKSNHENYDRLLSYAKFIGTGEQK